MKKVTRLSLACLLTAALLSGCSARVSTTSNPNGQDADFAPETTAETVTVIETPLASVVPDETLPEAVDTPIEITAEPTAEPAETPEPIDPLASYTFETLQDTSFGFIFSHPDDWINLPGKHTVCFREPVEEGDFAARVSITKKTFAHPPKASKVLDQFEAFARTVYAQYDPNTFELGDLNSSASFMGQSAYEITYMAYVGDVEVKGYMICCAIEHSMYVFHYYSSYEDYAPMKGLMTRMRDSVALIG